MTTALLRVVFWAAFLLTIHDLAGINDADAPTHVGGDLVFRLFAASRAGMLAIAGFFITHQADDRDARLLTIGLLGLCLNNHWYTYSPSDPVFWPAVVVNYAGIGASVGAFVAFVLYAVVDGAADPRAVAARRRGVQIVAAALGTSAAICGLVYPVFFFGPRYLPELADRGDRALWLVWTVASLVLVIGGILALRTAGDRGSRTGLYAFVLLGAGTAAHGALRLTLGNVDPRWVSGIDAVGQVVFAVLLAVAVFRHKRVLRILAATRGVRYTAVGAAFAIGFPALETYFDDFVAASSLHSLEAFGGERSAHVVLSVGSSLGFTQLDRVVENWVARLKPADDDPRSAASAAAPPPK